MVKQLTPFEALEACKTKAGSIAALAAALGVSTAAAWKWFQSTKRLPPHHVLKAENLYGVSRHDLAPNIYPRNYPPAPDDRFYGVDGGAPCVTRHILGVQHRHDAPANRKQGRAA